MTITAKIRIRPTKEQEILLLNAGRAFSSACDYVAGVVFDTHNLSQVGLQKEVYAELRSVYCLPSQMACNVVRHVIGNWRTILENQKEWVKPKYKHTTYDLSWNRDYSLTGGCFSVGTLKGRIKLAYDNKGMQKYFDGSWKFGVAKVVNKHGKWYLHIAVSKNLEDLSQAEVANVVGIDLGVNFLATTYNSSGNTHFYNGKKIKHKRGRYKKTRKQLQQRKTASARRRLKAIGSRENRWVRDINHQVSKALVDNNPKGTAFILEDLKGIRNAMEKIRLKDRYVTVSWAFFDFRQKLEYKAKMNRNTVIMVNPKYTSQTCPKCGHTERANRNKKTHTFYCKTCSYTSNDDRIGAMNLYRKGIEYLSTVTSE